MLQRLCALSVMIAVIAGAGMARADVVFTGSKKVRRDTVVDFGPYKDRAPWSYEVKAGDTLSALAEKHLGSAARHEQIVGMNPGLTAETLKAGATILMPPRAADSSQWMHFFAVGWFRDFGRAFHGQQLLHHRYSTRLWAVPQARIAEFLVKLDVDREERRGVIEALSKESWIFQADEKLCGYLTMSDSSAIAAIHESYTIDKIEAGKIVLTRHEVQNLDKEGKPISGAGLFVTPGNGVLLLLAAIGGAGLSVLARRRRIETFPEPVPAS